MSRSFPKRLVPSLLAACALAIASHPGDGWASPARVASLTLPGGQRVRAMAAVDDTVVCGTEQGPGPELFVIDASDPTRPVLARGFEIGADVNAVALQGSLAFLATSADDAELSILDLETGSAVGGYDAPGDRDGVLVLRGLPPSSAVLLGTAIDPDRPESYVLDVADPAAPIVTHAQDALADLRTPPPTIRTRAGCFTGGNVVARSRGVTEPALTFLAVDRRTREVQVFRDLDDEVTIPDANGDGVRHLACLGDSNTFPVFDKNPPSWCGYLQQRIWNAGALVTNYAELGATATPAATSSAQAQLQRALHDGADVVVLAFGTNDVVGFEPEEIADATQTLAQQAREAGAVALVATITPRFDDPVWGEKVERTSALLRTAVDAEHLLDFNAVLTASDLGPDQVHVALSGVIAQGELVEDRLVLPSRPSAACPRPSRSSAFSR